MIRFLITSLLLILGVYYIGELTPLNIIFALMYTVIVNDIFCHRICSHGMFIVNTQSITYKIFTWLASVDMGYGPVQWVTVSHNLHHIHSDKGPNDVMNWRHHWYSTTIVSPIPRFNNSRPDDYNSYVEKQYNRHGHILNDKYTIFCAKYQYYISIFTLVLLFFISTTLFEILCVSRLLLTIMTGIAGFAGHVKHFPLSYRQYNTNDTTSNNLLFHYMFLGLFAGMLQNNHHGQPLSTEPNNKWYELDNSKLFVLMFKYCMEKKC